jgi:hypothetical protein
MTFKDVAVLSWHISHVKVHLFNIKYISISMYDITYKILINMHSLSCHPSFP